MITKYKTVHIFAGGKKSCCVKAVVRAWQGWLREGELGTSVVAGPAKSSSWVSERPALFVSRLGVRRQG